MPKQTPANQEQSTTVKIFTRKRRDTVIIILAKKKICFRKPRELLSPDLPYRTC
jgi:hypothetical protein